MEKEVENASSEMAEEVTEPIVSHFIIHARKCLLNGLSVKENLRVPELNYDWVFEYIFYIVL